MDREPSFAPDERPTFSIFVALTWVFGAFLLFAIVLNGLVSLSPDAATDAVSQAALSAIVLLLVSALLLGRYPGGDTLGSALGFRSFPIWQAGLALVMGITAHIPAEALYRLVQRFFPISEAEEARMSEMLVGSTPVHATLLFVFLAIVVPISEEVFFRGAIFGALRRDKTTARGAAIFTSIAFTLFHPEPRVWAPVILLALLLGACRAANGTLLASLLVHIGFNALTLATTLSKAGKRLEDWASVPKHELALGGVFVAASLLFFLGCRSGEAGERRDLDEAPGDA